MNIIAAPPPFSLWLEFEAYASGYPQPGDDPERDFCNAIVRTNGRTCGLTIWTFGFIDYSRRHDESTGLPKHEIERYLLPPDLLVERLDRALSEEAIACELQRHFPSPAQWQWHDEENEA